VLEQELVLLSVASRVAYRALVPAAKQVASEIELSRTLPRIAAALGSVAPIHQRARPAGGMRLLSAKEVGDLLFQPGYESRAALDELFIRRADLHKAIEALRAGGSDFPG
jgi:hypothetical protein